MQEGKSILAHLWDEMDTKIAAVTPMAAESKRLKSIVAAWTDGVEPGDLDGEDSFSLAQDEVKFWQHEAEKNKVGGIGRGLATAIRLMSNPHFATDNDVVKHAMARYKANLAGEVIETPGNPGTYVPREPADDADAEPEPAVPTEGEKAVDAKKAATGAPKSTTAGQSSAGANTATSSTTETSPAPSSSAPSDDPDRPPTPEEVLDKPDAEPSNDRTPGTAMSVSEAVARAKQRQYEAKKDDPRYTFDDDTIAGAHSAEDIAAMLEGLPDE